MSLLVSAGMIEILGFITFILFLFAVSALMEYFSVKIFYIDDKRFSAWRKCILPAAFLVFSGLGATAAFIGFLAIYFVIAQMGLVVLVTQETHDTATALKLFAVILICSIGYVVSLAGSFGKKILAKKIIMET